jgi:ubiquitin-protein ligase
MYIIPDENNIKIWTGFLILKDGIYRNSIIKFIIKIPNDYPSVIPNVNFISKIYHPIINFNTGELDLKFLFNSWEPGKNFILQILYKIKDIFINPDFFNINNSFNSDAGNLFKNNYIEFEKNVIENSNENFNKFVNDSQKNKENFNEEEFIKDLKKILKKDVKINEKKEILNEFLLIK